jgi:hypothetical protein
LVDSGVPTVLRIHGWRVVIYPNDHAPAHVHVLGPGWLALVNLNGPQVREAIGCDERQANRILRVIIEHSDVLLRAWRRFHG